MARTYDVMRNLAMAAKPECEADFRKGNDVTRALDKHFPIEGGWATKPLCEGEMLLREVIAAQQPK